MTELQILEKIVDTISGDHNFQIKCLTKEVSPEMVLTSYPAKRKPAEHTYTLSIKRQRGKTKHYDTLYCYERRLPKNIADTVAANHSGNIFNELALQTIIDLGCKGMNVIL